MSINTAPSSSPPLLRAVQLECLRGETLLFTGLDLAVAPGEIMQIEGANGSGKTSLLRILAGLALPAEGEVSWRGHGIARKRESFNAEVAYLGHHLGLKGELTVHENLRMGLALAGRGKDDQARVDETLAAVGLADRGDVQVRALSAGQRQRVALARLMASAALLWILDEPFTALDSAGIWLVQRCLEEHAQRGGLAVLTSHQAVELRGGLSRFTLS